MSAEGTRRRRQRPGTAPVDGGIGQRGGGDPRVQVQSFAWPEPRTALCFLCLATCGALAGLVFQQSASCADVVERFHVLQMRDSELRTVQERLHDASEKCGKYRETTEHLQDLQIMSRINRLQQSVSHIEKWSDRIAAERTRLQRNTKAVSQTATDIERRITSSTKEASLKVTAVKTDVRRISGLQVDAKVVADSVQDLEMRLEAMEKKTVQSIGDMLAGSIEHVKQLKSSVLRNENRLDLMKEKLAELQSHFNKHTTQFLDLERDRMKLLKTVTFANDLKPTVYNLKRDFSLGEPMINDLALRIGKLAVGLLQREEEIVSLNKKIANLTAVVSDIKVEKHEVSNISD